MFTIKYCAFNPSATQCVDQDSPVFYDRVEQLSGPYDHISQEYVDGYMVVYAHRDGGGLGMTYGPIKAPDVEPGKQPAPRPTLYVMNESGATVAKYDL